MSTVESSQGQVSDEHGPIGEDAVLATLPQEPVALASQADSERFATYRAIAVMDQIVEQIEARYAAEVQALSDELRRIRESDSSWTEQRWIVALGHRAEEAERRCRDALRRLAVQELQNAALNEQRNFSGYERERLTRRLGAQALEIAELRQQAAEAEQARAALEAHLRDYREHGDRYLAELHTLMAAYRARVEAAERERDALAARV